MAQFEKEWDAETAKQGTFTAKKKPEGSQALKSRRSGDLEAQLGTMSVNDDDEKFKWKATNDSFSFNFDV